MQFPDETDESVLSDAMDAMQQPVACPDLGERGD